MTLEITNVVSEPDVDYTLILDGKEVEVKVLGVCRKTGSGIQCEVTKVMHEGRDRHGDVPEAHMQFMRQRLWHWHISNAGVADANETAEVGA